MLSAAFYHLNFKPVPEICTVYLQQIMLSLCTASIIHSKYRDPRGHHIPSVAAEDDLMRGRKTMTSVHVVT